MTERTQLEPEVLAAVLAAPATETDTAVSLRLGVPLSTVNRHRKRKRDEARSVARAVLEETVQEKLPDALQALGDALRLAAEQMEAEKTVAWVRETRECAVALLRYVGLIPEKDPLEDVDSNALLEEALRCLGRIHC